MLATAVVVIAAVAVPLSAHEPAAPSGAPPFLVARGGELYLNGKPYRAVGINMPFFTRVFTGQMAQNDAYDCQVQPAEAAVAKLKRASANGFEFVRFFGYPNSRMHGLIYDYAAKMVSRYKDDPNILMWEITNEGFLKADVVPAGSRDPKDTMSFAQFQQLYKEAAAHIKKHDPNHLVTSGDAHPREQSMSLRRGEKVRMDSVEEHLENLVASQSDPLLDVMSIHVYGLFGSEGKQGYKAFDEESHPALVKRAASFNEKFDALRLVARLGAGYGDTNGGLARKDVP